ncbi:hypothetical protein LTR66_016445, partial [Elasticomyces elasticus]
ELLPTAAAAFAAFHAAVAAGEIAPGPGEPLIKQEPPDEDVKVVDYEARTSK